MSEKTLNFYCTNYLFNVEFKFVILWIPEKKKTECTVVPMTTREECLDCYDDYYRSNEFTSLHELFSFTMSHSVRSVGLFLHYIFHILYKLHFRVNLPHNESCTIISMRFDKAVQSCKFELASQSLLLGKFWY